MRDIPIQVGSGQCLNAFSNAEIDWSPYLSEKYPMQIKVPSIARYSQLPKGNDIVWGMGEQIAPFLNEQERKIWNACKPLQDKRDDIGHAEIVTYLTYQIAKASGLSRQDTEVAVIAAILHDVGWSKIDNISQVFQQIQTDRVSVNESIMRSVKERDRELRILHQKYSVEIASELLSDYPGTFEVSDSITTRKAHILSIIGDHDTRIDSSLPGPIGACMWDADMLWRVTSVGVDAAYRQVIGVDKAYIIEKAQQWLALDRYKLQLPVSVEIGRLEFAAILK